MRQEKTDIIIGLASLSAPEARELATLAEIVRALTPEGQAHNPDQILDKVHDDLRAQYLQAGTPGVVQEIRRIVAQFNLSRSAARWLLDVGEWVGAEWVDLAEVL